MNQTSDVPTLNSLITTAQTAFSSAERLPLQSAKNKTSRINWFRWKSRAPEKAGTERRLWGKPTISRKTSSYRHFQSRPPTLTSTVNTLHSYRRLIPLQFLSLKLKVCPRKQSIKDPQVRPWTRMRSGSTVSTSPNSCLGTFPVSLTLTSGKFPLKEPKLKNYSG